MTTDSDDDANEDYFPFLEFPDLVIVALAKVSNPAVVVKISLVSHECAAKIKGAGVRMPRRVSISVHADQFQIGLERPGKELESFWSFPTQRHPNMRPVRITAHGKVFDCEHFESSAKYLWTILPSEQRIRGLASAVSHVCSLFQTTLDTIDVEGLVDPEIWSVMPACVNARINFNITREDLREFFTRVRINRRFAILADDSTFLWDQMDHLRHLREVRILSAHWVTLDHLRTLQDFRALNLGRTKLTNEDLNQWVSEWVNGNNRRLKHLSVTAINCEFYDGRVIGRGDWTHPPDFVRGPNQQRSSPYRLTIERPSDGVQLKINVLGYMAEFVTNLPDE